MTDTTTPEAAQVPLRQRTIPEQLDYLGDKLAAQIDTHTIPRDALIAMGATVVNMGHIATLLRKQAAPLTTDEFADLRAFCNTWLAELAQHGWLSRRLLLADGSELDVGRLNAALDRLIAAEAIIARVTSRMQEYGSGAVNIRQVLNLLSPTWPDGNYEAPVPGGHHG